MAQQEQFGKMTIIGTRHYWPARTMRRPTIAAIALCACVSAYLPVSAEDLKSAYTDFDADKCTRLSPGGTCQVGYVDARANPDANELARKIADEHARDFHCGKDQPIVLGKTDPDLAMPKGD